MAKGTTKVECLGAFSRCLDLAQRSSPDRLPTPDVPILRSVRVFVPLLLGVGGGGLLEQRMLLGFVVCVGGFGVVGGGGGWCRKDTLGTHAPRRRNSNCCIGDVLVHAHTHCPLTLPPR